MRRGEVFWAEHPDWPRRPAVNADHTDTVAKGFLGERITVLSPEKLNEVCRALDAATGCD